MTTLTHSTAAAETRPKAIGIWLLAICGLIFAMAVIGAITRLTESGLSIMEWAPLSGALPPLSQAEWQRLFDLYRTIPEYQLENAGMSLAEFKTIFWWEWIHRQWGRLIGLAFFLPFLWFLLRRQVPAWLTPHLWFALGLGALQGFMGWFMVASGFSERSDVSQYRLVLHLGLALVIYGYLFWLALRLLLPAEGDSALRPALRRGLWTFFGVLVVTLVSGGLVAGLNAGMTYNSYPFMDGRLIPAGYAPLSPWLLNWGETIEAVQFNHRLLAHLLVVGGLGLWLWSRFAAPVRAVRRAFDLLAIAVSLQLLLGIWTLLAAVPVWLGAVHQAGAILVLTATLYALFQCQGRRSA